MTYPTNKAAIVGVYTTKQARSLDRTSVSLQIEALKGALDDAGLDYKDVDGIVSFDPSPYGKPPTDPFWPVGFMFWAEQLGERPLTYTDFSLASGALAKAAAAIGSGLCNVVALVWGKSRWKLNPKDTPVPDRAPRVDDFSFELAGAHYSTWYALWAQRYMYEFGATSEDLAQVAINNRYHATLNPDSIMGPRGLLSVDDVVNSRMIADPLHLLDCALDNDGGYAIIIASAEVARNCRKKPVRILGGAEAFFTDFYISVDDPWFPEDGKAVAKVGNMAFGMAGVTRDDIDVAGLYDCFTITMLRDLEELGFCKRGEAADFVREGHTRLGGKMPCNTDGGMLSNSANAFPSGMHAIEVVRQLRGQCGLRQVPNAKIGLSLSQGYAVHGLAGAVIMAVD